MAYRDKSSGNVENGYSFYLELYQGKKDMYLYHLLIFFGKLRIKWCLSTFNSKFVIIKIYILRLLLFSPLSMYEPTPEYLGIIKIVVAYYLPKYRTIDLHWLFEIIQIDFLISSR